MRALDNTEVFVTVRVRRNKVGMPVGPSKRHQKQRSLAWSRDAEGFFLSATARTMRPVATRHRNDGTASNLSTRKMAGRDFLTPAKRSRRFFSGTDREILFCEPDQGPRARAAG